MKRHDRPQSAVDGADSPDTAVVGHPIIDPHIGWHLTVGSKMVKKSSERCFLCDANVGIVQFHGPDDRDRSVPRPDAAVVSICTSHLVVGQRTGRESQWRNVLPDRAERFTISGRDQCSLVRRQ